MNKLTVKVFQDTKHIQDIFPAQARKLIKEGLAEKLILDGDFCVKLIEKKEEKMSEKIDNRLFNEIEEVIGNIGNELEKMQKEEISESLKDIDYLMGCIGKDYVKIKVGHILICRLNRQKKLNIKAECKDFFYCEDEEENILIVKKETIKAIGNFAYIEFGSKKMFQGDVFIVESEVLVG